jgi:hypothetical protein
MGRQPPWDRRAPARLPGWVGVGERACCGAGTPHRHGRRALLGAWWHRGPTRRARLEPGGPRARALDGGDDGVREGAVAEGPRCHPISVRPHPGAAEAPPPLGGHGAPCSGPPGTAGLQPGSPGGWGLGVPGGSAVSTLPEPRAHAGFWTPKPPSPQALRKIEPASPAGSAAGLRDAATESGSGSGRCRTPPGPCGWPPRPGGSPSA